MKLKGKGYLITIITLILIVLGGTLGYVFLRKNTTSTEVSAELSKTRTYEKVNTGDEKTSSEYVQFDSFFLRDLDGDGYADKVRGTCKEIGKQDTLYMELNVLTEGYLKDGKITINNDNFYLETAILKDEEVANNYISSNTKQIALNNISNGTQKLLTGVVKSGDYSKIEKTGAIGNDPSKYSKINSVILTGTHVIENEDGTTTETPISKTVNFNVDWYGEVDCSISSYSKNQDKVITNCIDETNGTLNLSFDIETLESKNELILKKSYIEGTIPEMNGYAPTKVEVKGTNVTYTYDEETRRFTAQREAIANEQGQVTTIVNSSSSNETRYNEYTLNVTYPLEVYTESGADTVELKIPVKAYYEGYNNTSSEFTNPYKSNIAEEMVTISWSNPRGYASTFYVYVGKYVSEPAGRYLVSKQKPLNIYNGTSVNEIQDYYTVRWIGSTGTEGESDGMIMKETADGSTEKISDQFIKADSSTQSMADLSKNVGIYFSNPIKLLGKDGWIKVYDDDTNKEIASFTKDNWNKYSSSTPYMYEQAVKHIRIETSKTNKESRLEIYNVKELDDEYITENYTEEEFNNLKYIKSTLVGYLNRNGSNLYVNTDTHIANYEEPVSIADLEINPQTISTQETQNNYKIKIRTRCDSSKNKLAWKNGSFLLKFPKEIIGLEINNITINNSKVQINSYEKYEEDGNIFVKILTENEKEADYTIEIDCNLSPNPKSVTTSKDVILYASNQNCENYYYVSQDIYDVDGDLNKEENVNYVTETLNLVSPNSLLTSQEARDFNLEGEKIIAPQKAEVSKEQRTAKVCINITNNYSSTISEVKILGKIPFENNTYILSGKNAGSNYSTIMTSDGITVPENLKDIVKVYYTTNENPTKDLTDSSNGWIETPEDYSQVKSFLIDLSEYTLEKGDSQDFIYEIQLPEGIEYNKISYSMHAVYFTLDTDQGKYKTQTEPSKLGFLIAKKYDLELTKYQKDSNTKKVSGATYSITEEGEKESKTGVTGADGKITLKGLYAGKIYVLKEIKSPTEYVLNTDEIKFKTDSDTNGNLDIEIIDGTPKLTQVTKNENENYKAEIVVEDEVKANLEIVKTNQKTNEKIKNVKYKITGEGLGTSGKIQTTNSDGKIKLNGLYLNKEYTIEEVKATGYYLTNPITFKITEENGLFKVNIISGTVKNSEITINDEIPTIRLNLENEPIPTYNLKLIKQEKDKDTKLEGAQFKLEGEEIKSPKYYTTDENGVLTIDGLYQYVEGKGLECTYTLTETYAPEGYAVTEPITFKAQEIDGNLQLIIESGTVKSQETNGTTIQIVVEDKTIFKLTKADAKTGKLLPNAKFEIYEIDENRKEIDYAKDGNGNVIGVEVTTDENGEILCGIRAGLYKAIEIEAPEGYELPENIEDRTYYFGIGKGEPAVYEGKIMWENTENVEDTTGGYKDTCYYGVTTLKDGEIAVGAGSRYGVIGRRGIVAKYDLDGNLVWENIEKEFCIYRGVTTVRNEVIPVAEDVIAVTEDGQVVKYDLEGNIVWENTEKNYTYYGVTTVEDGVIAVANGGQVVKYDLDGNIVWENTKKYYKYYGVTTVGDGVIAVANGGQVVKYDSKGSVVWENTENKYEYLGVTTVEDGVIAVAGRRSSKI